MPSTVRINVVTDASQTARELNNTGQNVDTLGTKFNTMKTRAVTAMRGMAIAGAAYLAAQFGRQLVERAAELDLMAAKSEQVFGDMQRDVIEWAGTVAEEFGASTRQIEGLAATTTDLLVGAFGLTRDEAFEMTKDILELGSDLDLFSTKTGSTAEAVDILTKAMLGERESLERLGVKVSQAQVDAYLLEQGLEDLTGQELAAAQAAAVLAIATDQSGNAIAFAEGEASKNARTVRVLESRWEELQDNLAQYLIPVLSQTAAALVVVTDHLNYMRIAIDQVLTFAAEKFQFVTGIVNGLAVGISRIVNLLSSIPSSIPNPFSGWSIPDLNPFNGGFNPLGGLFGSSVGAAAAGGGITVNVQALDPAAAANAVVDALRAWERRNGPIGLAA